MIQKEVLDNGLRIVTEDIDYVQSASIGIWVGVGARDEEDQLRGISHVIEHMLFKGTEKRSAQQIADEVDRVGGYLNAFTDKEYTCYYAKVLSEYIPVAVDVLSDMFLNSVVNTEELGREKNVILEEIKRHEDQPDDLVHDVFFQTIWPQHVLGKPVIGTSQTVSSFNRDHLLNYMHRRYTPDTIVVSAAGNLEHKKIVDMVAERFGSLKGKRSDWREPDTTPKATVAQKSVSKPVEQVHVVLGVPGYSQTDDRRYKLSLLDTVLGGGMSSRLFQEIREKRGLAYSVGSYTASYREGGLFAVYAGTSPTTAEEVIEIVKREFDNVRTHNVTDDELLRAKNQIRGGMVMAQESMSNRMMRMGKNELVHDRIIPIEEIMGKIQEVTLDDLHDTAKTIFSTGYTLAQVGPFDEKDKAAAQMLAEENEAIEHEVLA
jgi:predicted Zn-dependent peptidase